MSCSCCYYNGGSGGGGNPILRRFIVDAGSANAINTRATTDDDEAIRYIYTQTAGWERR